MSTTRTCKTCRWWCREYPGENWREYDYIAQCRLNGPSLVEMPYTRGAETKWPLTRNTDFCGQHQPTTE